VNSNKDPVDLRDALMPPRRGLILGDYDHPDFEPAVAWLRQRAQTECFRDAQDAAQNAAVAELILFAQSRPGRFGQSDVERLHAASPLARLAVLLGVWCEGEMRTDAPLRGVMRIYWHEWEAKLPPLWSSSDECAAWRLPRTSLPGERTLAESSIPENEFRQLIAIRARGAASYAALAHAVHTGGFTSVWLDPRQPSRTNPAALLWEGDFRVPSELEELSCLVAAFPRAPAIVLGSFLRPEDRRVAIGAGAVDIVGKPFLISELMRRLHAALRPADEASLAAARPW
jgi:hypothetical protein